MFQSFIRASCRAGAIADGLSSIGSPRPEFNPDLAMKLTLDPTKCGRPSS
jgi:hypothetical protein